MENQRKIERSGELMWLLGTVLVALGVCLCKKADLGVSMIAAPTFIIYDAIAPLFKGLSVGVTEYLLQGVLLLLLCAVVRRFNWRYLLAFVVAVVYGYVLDFWLLVFGPQPFDALYVRWIMLFVGDIITAAGVACYFRTYLPLQVYELFVAEVSDRYKFSITKTKLTYDLCSFCVSVLLALLLFGDEGFDFKQIYHTSFHSIGLGTVITSFINAPIISFIGKQIDKVFGGQPRFTKLYTALSRNKQSTDEGTEQSD